MGYHGYDNGSHQSDKNMANKKYTFFSLFSGAGGLDIGFKEVGFESLGSSDFMDESEETYRLNWPSEPFIKKDIRKLTVSDILKITGGKKPDVILGGPPCQGFSVMGDKNSSDPRNTLSESYVRIVDDLRPKCFVFENVKGFKTMFGGKFISKTANSFSALGYDVYVKVLNASNYGVPQNRERVFLVGTKTGHSFQYPAPSQSGIGKLKSYRNVNEAIMDLSKKGDEIKNHIVLDHGDTVVARYKLIPEGGNLPSPEKLPLEIRRKNFGNTYTRLHRKKIAPTMVPGNNAFPIHPTLDRSLTPREAARIQTFPDKIIFAGTRRHQCILVGNAVPALLGAHVAKSIKAHLDKKVAGSDADLFLKKNGQISTEARMVNERGTESGEPTFIDLFSGAGGISIGLMNAGMIPILSSDNDKYVAMTHKHNFPQIPFVEGDVSSSGTKKEIMDIVGIRDVDFLVGGPPCQGFSIFGERRFLNTQTREYDPHKEPRNKLVYVYLDYIKTLRPKWFMMENVPGFASLDGGYFLKHLLKEIDKLGYKNHDWKIINTADYGVPQRRKRFILIGNRTGNIIPWPKAKFFENPEDWQKPYRTVGEVIEDLAHKGSERRMKNHEAMEHSPHLKERFVYIEEGKKMDISKLPKHLRFGKNTGKEIKNYSHVYKRLHRNKPSTTLVPGHSAFPIHPTLNRTLTVREGARIQTFPDNVEFLGPRSEQYRQVGNAFPVLAAEHIGNFIIKAIKNDWKDENISKLAHYSLIDVAEARATK